MKLRTTNFLRVFLSDATAIQNCDNVPCAHTDCAECLSSTLQPTQRLKEKLRLRGSERLQSE
jgi:hypothetical protein